MLRHKLVLCFRDVDGGDGLFLNQDNSGRNKHTVAGGHSEEVVQSSPPFSEDDETTKPETQETIEFVEIEYFYDRDVKRVISQTLGRMYPSTPVKGGNKYYSI